MLLSAGFRRSLSEALRTVGSELADLGVTSELNLRTVLVRAYRRLGKAKVTATDWLGQAFEIIGPDLPELRVVEDAADGAFLGLVNGYIAQGKRGFAFTNGQGERVGVRSPFTSHEVIHNVRIRRPGQQTGTLYVDRGRFVRNRGDQALFMSREYKTRGASGELTEQITRRDPRLLDEQHPDGTQLTYEVEGQKGTYTIDLKNVILVSGGESPALLRESGVFSRMGVRAGAKFRATIAKDQNGEPYVRIVVAVATDPLRKILEKVLRDRSWQR